MTAKFFITIITNLFLISCNTKINQSELNDLYKRWKVDYVELNGKRVDNLFGENEDFDYEFKKDYTYVIYSSKNESGVGKWEFNKDENCVYFRNAENEIHGKVVNISKDRIVLIPTSQIGNNPELELVKYYYIPK